MADTILILGNGFDLAMGRKTSYNDFLEFAEKLFAEKDVQLEDFLYSNQIDIEKYRNNLYIQFINENKLKLGDNWSNLENPPPKDNNSPHYLFWNSYSCMQG